MRNEDLISRLRASINKPIPLPGAGNTAERHRCLMEIGREDLSLARLAEAHWDAVAILAESGRLPVPGAIYGVWASEVPGEALKSERVSDQLEISGEKMFCSGAGLIDRALVTVGQGRPLLVDVDLRGERDRIDFDSSGWKTWAFADTGTARAKFKNTCALEQDVIGEAGWYLSRPGFWHGACGPAACWAGGAAGLLEYALSQRRNDAHTVSHLGAIYADVWALRSYLDTAGREIDDTAGDVNLGRMRALYLRHLVEQSCTDILRRITRAYGPHPICMDEEVARRYAELDLYLRQSHAERDLEALGRMVRTPDQQL